MRSAAADVKVQDRDKTPRKSPGTRIEYFDRLGEEWSEGQEQNIGGLFKALRGGFGVAANLFEKGLPGGTGRQLVFLDDGQGG